MSFQNPIIGGNDTLVRQAMQSEGFQTGVTGWRIERDGDAEFNDVVVRGELDVTGTDGSYVRAVAQGGHADVLLNPQDVVGQTWDPAVLTADVDPGNVGTDIPALTIRSPAAQGSVEPAAEIFMLGPGELDQNAISLRANSIDMGKGSSPTDTTVNVTGSFFVTGDSLFDGSVDVTGDLNLGAWTSFTPTWTASTTNPSLGNGTVDAAYRVCGSTVFFRISYVFGSTTNFGSGAWGFSLPVAPISPQAASAVLADSSASNRLPGTAWLTAGSGIFRVLNTSGSFGTSSTSPFTWATGDGLIISGSYET
ncbi:hypothetical protein ACQPZP_14635 [Spirillospora sp. CA-142024]|uniref:hypothetical protein n=1 Tax=Spirillospora sp. CA-142024 TaxID=3240036 RepID=UPI003D9428B4